MFHTQVVYQGEKCLLCAVDQSSLSTRPVMNARDSRYPLRGDSQLNLPLGFSPHLRIAPTAADDEPCGLLIIIPLILHNLQLQETSTCKGNR